MWCIDLYTFLAETKIFSSSNRAIYLWKSCEDPLVFFPVKIIYSHSLGSYNIEIGRYMPDNTFHQKMGFIKYVPNNQKQKDISF